MPHVSNRKLEDNHIEVLYKEFVYSLEKCFDDRKSLAVFNQFFTNTEREMFAKRFAVIAMLSKKISSAAISRTLKMSPTTVETMAARFEASRYDWVVRAAIGKKDIWKIIDDITKNMNTAGGLMPPRVGMGRWDKFNKSVR